MLQASSLRPVVGACVFCGSTVLAVPPEDVLQRLGLRAEERAQAATSAGATSTSNPIASSPPPGWNVWLLGQVPPQAFSTNASCNATSTNVCANDCWGYVSPSGREYAIIGLRTGTGFVDVTDPENPEVVTSISDASSVWSDVRTFGTYAYNVNESGGGLQVFDLSNIDPPTRQVTLVNTLTASGLQTTHNIVVNQASATLYLCGSNLGGGRLVAVSLADPANPVIVGSTSDSAYVHDADVVTYTDGPYAGREIAFTFCGSGGLHILDVTNKSNMFRISMLDYPDRRYCHQGRVTDDRQYVIFNDELDELQDPDVTVTTTRVVDVSDLSNPVLVNTFTTGLSTIDHNLYIRGNHVFEANYTSGMHVFNIADVFNVEHVGFYDTYSFNNGLSFDGAWNVWPYLPSGNILVSDMQGGLFILDASDATDSGCEVTAAPTAGEFPEPKQRYLSITPGNPGVVSALRVKLVSLPPGFAAMQGQYRYVDVPVELQDPKGSATTYFRARLSCTPRYMDWGAYGSIEISDDAILPGATYEIQALGESCLNFVSGNYSPALTVTTAPKWGDIVGPTGNVPPDGATNVIDLAEVVDAVRALPGSIDVTQADLEPSEPDFRANAVDIGRSVDAVKGFPYPFPGPTACP